MAASSGNWPNILTVTVSAGSPSRPKACGSARPFQWGVYTNADLNDWELVWSPAGNTNPILSPRRATCWAVSNLSTAGSIGPTMHIPGNAADMHRVCAACRLSRFELFEPDQCWTAYVEEQTYDPSTPELLGRALNSAERSALITASTGR